MAKTCHGQPEQPRKANDHLVAQSVALGIDWVGWALFRPRPPQTGHGARDFGEQLASLD
jgi:hypothetical protein